MEIRIVGHEFQYDVTGMSLLFFPGESVVFVKRAKDANWLSSRLIGEKNKIARATFYWNGKCYRCEKKADGLSKESLLAAVKYTIYQVFRRATGITPPWGILTGIKPTGIYQRLLAEKGVAKIRSFLMEEYCLQPEKIPLLHQICKVMETVKTDSSQDASLYVSIPFCPSRCSYCSFISVAAERTHKLISPYLDYLVEEIREKCAVLRKHQLKIRSVYVGGGTPGILTPEQMERLLQEIQKEIKEPLEEFTFELGRPDTVTPKKLALLKEYGVTRVCINTQTTNDAVLAAIGRKHTGKEYMDAVAMTRSYGFESINTDLIAGLPGESEESFAHSLEDVISAGADNITIHTLSIKKSAKFHETDAYFDPKNDRVQRMLDAAYRRLMELGYLPYYMYRQKNTVSNGENVGFSKPDTIGKYNLYMMEDLHSIAACGAGASSKIISGKQGRIERVINMKYPFEYINENQKIHYNTEEFDQKLKESL